MLTKFQDNSFKDLKDLEELNGSEGSVGPDGWKDRVYIE